MAKKTLGRKYGIALAKQYFGQITKDADLEDRGIRAKAKTEAAIRKAEKAGEITQEDAEEINTYSATVSIYEAVKMAYSAYAMQAVVYIHEGSKRLRTIRQAEETHFDLMHRPLLVFDQKALDTEGRTLKDPTAKYADAWGDPLDSKTLKPKPLEPPAWMDRPFEREELMKHIANNDVYFRLFMVGAAIGRPAKKDEDIGLLIMEAFDRVPSWAADPNKEELEYKEERKKYGYGNPDKADIEALINEVKQLPMKEEGEGRMFGGSTGNPLYMNLLETSKQHENINECREAVLENISLMKKYRFAAETLEAFLQIEGAAEALAPLRLAETVEDEIARSWNLEAAAINEDIVMRWSCDATSSLEYMRKILSQAREEWLKEITQNTGASFIAANEGEAKVSARRLDYGDLRTIRTFERFINKQNWSRLSRKLEEGA